MILMSVSLIFTVLNEAKTLPQLWHSIATQTKQPDEVIVVDGGSTDETIKVLQELAATATDFKTQILVKPGNRSVGRNAAIAQAASNLIACTDAGCILDPHWLEELLLKQATAKADVVAGFYQGLVTTSWQAAVIPYVLVMPDRLPQPPEIFLPATRSVLFTKKAWEKAGKFDESLSDNEDFAFAHSLKRTGAVMSFTAKALVTWIPPTTWWSTAVMFFRFARGDSQAKLWRPKVALIFARYILAVFLVILALSTRNAAIWSVLFASAVIYIYWSIAKNYRYAKPGWWWLPLLQLTADGSVMLGTLAGLKAQLTPSKAARP
jgi:glycosyltransferase involved in cell wall biosynthesis